MALPSILRRHFPALLAFFGIIVVIQLVGAAVTFPNLAPWYESLRKPQWTPPRGAFGPTWTVLYLMLTFVGWRFWISFEGTVRQKLHQPVVALSCLQLLFNFFWSPVFFGLHLLVPALLVIGMMIVLTVLTIVYGWRVNRSAALLLLPYLVWITYAASLNAAIVVLN